MKIGDKVIILNAYTDNHNKLHPENSKFQGLKGTITEVKNLRDYVWVVRFKNHTAIKWVIDRYCDREGTWWFTEEDLKLQSLQLEFSFMETK